jgi:hypothetical protein
MWLTMQNIYFKIFSYFECYYFRENYFLWKIFSTDLIELYFKKSGRSCLLGPGHHADDILEFANHSPCSLFYGDDNGRLKLVQAGQGRVTHTTPTLKARRRKIWKFVREQPHTHTHFICV